MTNTPTISTVVGVGPWMDKRARVHQGPLTHPLLRFLGRGRLRTRDGVARLASVFGNLKFSLCFSFGGTSASCQMSVVAAGQSDRQGPDVVAPSATSGPLLIQRKARPSISFARQLRRGQDGSEPVLVASIPDRLEAGPPGVERPMRVGVARIVYRYSRRKLEHGHLHVTPVVGGRVFLGNAGISP